MKHVSKMTEAEIKAARAARPWRQAAVVGEVVPPPPEPEAIVKARQNAINSDLRIAFKYLGAIDANDALTLVDRRRIRTNDAGEITNADQLAADVKKAKPHFFGEIKIAKHARDMTPEEYKAARRNRAWRNPA